MSLMSWSRRVLTRSNSLVGEKPSTRRRHQYRTQGLPARLVQLTGVKPRTPVKQSTTSSSIVRGLSSCVTGR